MGTDLEQWADRKGVLRNRPDNEFRFLTPQPLASMDAVFLAMVMIAMVSFAFCNLRRFRLRRRIEVLILFRMKIFSHDVRLKACLGQTWMRRWRNVFYMSATLRKS